MSTNKSLFKNKQYKTIIDPFPENISNIRAESAGRSEDVTEIGKMIDHILLILQLFKESAKYKNNIGPNGMKKSIPKSFRKGLVDILEKLIELEKRMQNVHPITPAPARTRARAP